MMRSTRACGGPVRAHSTSASTASAGPWATASTEPPGRFHTQPVTPRRSALRRIDSRNHTPCTVPGFAGAAFSPGDLLNFHARLGAAVGREDEEAGGIAF